MIEVQNLTKHYGSLTAIRDVSFSVAPGEIVGFLGPNGAGKSTTMRILSCFMPASGGTAVVAGYDVFRERSEETRLNSSHTVISYAVFCLKKKKCRGSIQACSKQTASYR